jgi:hypothetical protein
MIKILRKWIFRTEFSGKLFVLIFERFIITKNLLFKLFFY